MTFLFEGIIKKPSHLIHYYIYNKNVDVMEEEKVKKQKWRFNE